MAAYNKVILMGNLTRDPELRYTGSGTAVCSLGLAVNRTYKTQSGELREDPCFIDVTAWGKQAESCNNYLKKGAPVFIEGTLRFETWTDKTSGQNRSKHTISADAVRFLGAPQQGSGGFQDNPGQFSQQGQAPRPQSQPAQPQYSAPQQSQPSQPQYQAPPAQASAPAQAPQQNQQAPAAPTNQAQQSSGFEPPPMPSFEVESEDDIPF